MSPSAGLLADWSSARHSYFRGSKLVEGLTDWIRAPELLVPFVTATALPFMSELDFCLLTTIWEDPKEFEAGRLEADIVSRKDGAT